MAAASVVFPAATWAEASGTYLNVKGLKQRSDKAIELLGSAKPAWEQVAVLAHAMGYETTWQKLSDIRARLGLVSPPPAPPALHATVHREIPTHPVLVHGLGAGAQPGVLSGVEGGE